MYREMRERSSFVKVEGNGREELFRRRKRKAERWKGLFSR
jgi:hypothetical protein